MSEKKAEKNSAEFYIGILLIAAGLFFLLSKTVVSSGFYNWHVGSFYISSGLVIIPLMAGIIWLFYNPKSWFAKILTFVGAVFILASIIMGINISFSRTTMFDYLIMIILIASGAGVMLRYFFKKEEK